MTHKRGSSNTESDVHKEQMRKLSLSTSSSNLFLQAQKKNNIVLEKQREKEKEKEKEDTEDNTHIIPGFNKMKSLFKPKSVSDSSEQ